MTDVRLITFSFDQGARKEHRGAAVRKSQQHQSIGSWNAPLREDAKDAALCEHLQSRSRGMQFGEDACSRLLRKQRPSGTTTNVKRSRKCSHVETFCLNPLCTQ